MITKIKINFTKAEADELSADAVRFKYVKKDGSSNMGSFMNELIQRLVDKRQADYKSLLSSIKNLGNVKTINANTQNELLDFDSKRYFGGRLDYTKPILNTPISFRPSTDLAANFDVISDRVPRGSSISEYLRSLIVGYLSLPSCYKIPLICSTEYNRVSEAFHYQRCLNILKNGERILVRPYCMIPNSDKSSLSLIGLISEMGDPIQPIVVDFLEVFQNAFMSAEYCDFNDEEREFLNSLQPEQNLTDNSARKRPEKRSNCVIKANGRAIDLLNERFPQIEAKKAKEGTFKLSGNEEDLYLALLYLGPDAFCVQPSSLQRRLRNAFQDADEAYDSNGILLDL